jgi:cytochrome c biogenesis protein ResB
MVKRKDVALPFALSLKDFRKVDYPSTNRPMSFESDVALYDPSDGTIIQKTIKMNKPLDHRGYRIFQSSYVQNQDHGEASVFTITKNPGIKLIYPGAVVMCLGICLVFFVKPFSSLKMD